MQSEKLWDFIMNLVKKHKKSLLMYCRLIREYQAFIFQIESFEEFIKALIQFLKK